ncbi:MAG TPA: RDD family protein [Rhodoferax sp.]|nr:RDD family protein [Rhodoferax sp.]HNV60081.1 RDD family protein [Rhodoferax sp.]
MGAGLGTRIYASLIDAIALAGVSAPLMWLAYGESIARMDDIRPASLAINWLMPMVATLMGWHFLGATPGKWLMSARVVDARTGEAPNWLQCVVRWLAYWVSLLPLGLGFLWIGVDSNHQGWHDKISRTRVIRTGLAATADAKRRSARSNPHERGYFSMHWHGDLSLVVSFWVNNVLLSVPMGFALGGLMVWITLKGDYIRTSSIAALVGWPLMLALTVWSSVGLWRSASRHVDLGGITLWAFLAKGFVAFGMLGTAVSTVFNYLPQVHTHMQMARGIDPIGKLEMTLSHDKRTLRLSGPIGLGDGRRFEELAGNASMVRTIELKSPGGRIYEATKIATQIHQNRWQTRVAGDCESACTLVFLAGSRKQVSPKGRLGFHRASSGTLNPVIDELANQELAKSYAKADLPKSFIQTTLSTPPWSMWYPDLAELIAAGLTPAPSDTLLIDLPADASAPVEDYTELLSGNVTWAALDHRYPGTIDTAAQQMRQARLRGGDEREVLSAGQRLVQSLVPEILRTTSIEAVDNFIYILLMEMRFAQQLNPSACLAVLNNDADVRRNLPPELLRRQAVWLAHASALADSQRKPHHPSALELEVIQRSMGGRASEQLLQLWGTRGQGHKGPDCSASIELLQQVLQLPIPQRRLAGRFAFQHR